MLDPYLILDFVVVFALTALGLTVFLKDKSLALNKTFALFVISVGVWIVANYISNDIDYSPRVAQIANFFVFSFSYAASTFLLIFAIILADDSTAKRTFRRFLPLIAVAGVLGATPLVVKGVTLQEQLYAVDFGPALPVYAVALLSIIVSLFWVTWKNNKRATDTKKARLNVLFVSLCWSIPLVVLANFILPAATGWFGLTNIGIFPMLILVIGLYYGVIKHRLFDLRPVIVRTAAYVMSLGVLAAFFILSSNFVKALIDSTHNQAIANVLNMALITFVLLIFSPVKRIFDRFTDRIFYQDAYEPQQLFDQLNKLLVSSLDIGFLMGQSTTIIGSYLRPEHCIIGLRQGERLFGEYGSELDVEEVAQIRTWAHDVSGNVIVADYLSEKDHALRDHMQNNNIAVLVKLRSSSRKHVETLGEILLSVKKSGNAYSQQDLLTLEAVSNVLILAIQNALRFEESQHFNVILQEKVEEATRKLRATNEKLKALDETKDDFISMASHQLRTPLTSVKGYLSMVIEGDAGKITSTQKKMLNQAYTSSQRMVYLIADLLNVSRLKTGKFVIEPSPVSLAKMVEEELAQLTEAASAHELTLTYHKPPDFPVLELDETKTRQVVMNFIDNAIYYTPPGGHIDVVLEETPTSVELKVIDDGIGVPKPEQHHLFTKFYRAGNARKARPDGTGLGLFMAKKVILAQGGSVIFDSKENKGSTFGFLFPKPLPVGSGTIPVAKASKTAKMAASKK